MLLSALLNLVEKDYDQLSVWLLHGKYYAALNKGPTYLSASGDTAEETVEELLDKLAAK